MDRFAPALLRVSRELDLPPAERSVILMEMAADLEAIFERERERGANEDAAARRAERMVLGSSEMLRRLSQVHRRSWRGWSERTGARLARGVDLFLVLLGVVPVLIVATAVAAPAVLSSRSPGTWLLIIPGTLLIVTIAVEAWRVGRQVGGKPHDLSMIVVLSALAPACGALALALGVYHTAMERSAARTVAGDQMVIAAAVARHGPLLVLGLLLGIAGALSWFMLLHFSAAHRVREVEALLSGHGPAGSASQGDGVLPLVRGRPG